MKRYIIPLTPIVLLLGAMISCSVSNKRHHTFQPRGNYSPFSSYSNSRSDAQWILNSSAVQLATRHISGVRDRATARDNISQAAQGLPAKRSSYGNAPGGHVRLHPRMLRGIRTLAQEGYRMNITSIAGSSHSRRSRHYLGVAFDVNRINGTRVSSGNPYYRKFMARARQLGATEVLGPGSRGHSGHVHIAWPRPPGT